MNRQQKIKKLQKEKRILTVVTYGWKLLEFLIELRLGIRRGIIKLLEWQVENYKKLMELGYRESYQKSYQLLNIELKYWKDIGDYYDNE